MTIYIGDAGKVQITRTGTGDPLYSTLQPADVNVSAKRFSVNFASASVATGDRLSIKRIQDDGDEKDLQLVDGHNFPDWTGYVSKDALGGLRLYDTFSDAIAAQKDTALTLALPSESQQIQIQTRSTRERCLGQVQNYELTTTRETVDTTTLSEQFRNKYSNGLISGQGQLSCFWEHSLGLCDEGAGPETEFSAYLAHICLRHGREPPLWRSCGAGPGNGRD